jgi:hypothetical protein
MSNETPQEGKDKLKEMLSEMPRNGPLADKERSEIGRIEEVGDAERIFDANHSKSEEAKKLPQPVGAAEILENMAVTFRERNAVYGDNYLMISKLVKVLFPDGVPPGLVEQDQWHLFELILVKLSRFAISNLAHVDSIHDTGVYSAMIEAIIAPVLCDEHGECHKLDCDCNPDTCPRKET